jgi:acylphosphatase
MSEDQKARLHARVHGNVQGVGFRYFTLENANRLNLTGWVRNRHDGTVEVIAEGSRSDLDDLLKKLRRGPRANTTSSVDPDWHEASGEFDRFRVRNTV